MAKITLNDVADLTNFTTAETTINNNNTAIEVAIENTLSRDGTTPNTMSANLDMNAHRILNLPAPSTINEPARLVDVVTNPTITIPPTGTSGATVPLLNGANTWSGAQYFEVNPWDDVKAYGAVGNGVADDTTAIQAAITAAQARGGVVFFPAGSYKITASLNIANGVKLRGVGMQGDSGGGFLGNTVTQTTGFLGSVIVVPNNVHGIVAVTNKAVQIQDLQITYPGVANANITAIKISAVAGAGNANTQSYIHNCMITGGAFGIDLENCLDFRIDGNDILYQITYGIVINSPNYPSYQQASISNNQIWGAGNAGYNAQILCQAGGDMRITNNKLTTGGVNTSAISLFGAASGAQNMEPMVIVGNSIEGQQNGIAFATANATFLVANCVITGNQIWCGGKSILINPFGAVQYVQGLVVTGNCLSVNGGAGVTVAALDGILGATVTGNIFNLAGGGSASTGLALGANASNITVSANNYAAGITAKVTDAGTNNSISDNLTFPNVSDTLVARNTTDTLTNKTLTTPAITGPVTVTGTLTTTGVVQTGGDVRTTAQFDKTSSTVLANIPGLSVTVVAGQTYGFKVGLFYTANVASGIQMSMSGTATATAIIYQNYITTASGFSLSLKSTSLGASAGSTPSTGDYAWMEGTITVNAGGTLTAQFAQNASGGTASSVLIGSTMRVWKIA